MSEEFESQYDLLVIGGGATGGGIALDATLRGLKTILVEQNDFAEGTSSRSTKLVHGGVRYLEDAVKHLDKEQFNLVKEGLKERYKLLHNAPHLSHTVSLLTPLYHWWEVPYIYAGLFLYDMISGRYRIGKSTIVCKKEVLSSNRFIKKEGLKAAVKYYDGAFNDARMVIALIQSAEEKGAIVKNYMKVESLIKTDGKVVGATVYDKTNNEHHDIYAKYIVNATGPFCDNIRKMANDTIKKIMRPSSGTHIVLDKKYLPSKSGIMIPKTKDGRVLFMLPYLGKCLVGTTDNEARVEEHPKVPQSDIDYLLEHINHYFDARITEEDIISSFVGFRPLVDLNHDDNTASLVREHIIEELPCGLITIAGGKWTTYRNMAEGLVDKLSNNPCLTHDYKVIGSRHDLKTVKKEILDTTKDSVLTDRLLSLYGDRALKVIEIAKEEGFYMIDDKYKILKAEILYCMRYEYIKKPQDFLTRRILLEYTDKKEADRLLDSVATVIAQYN